MLGRVFKGRETLGRTYWLWYILPVFAANMLALLYAYWSVPLAVSQPELAGALGFGVIGILLAVAFFGGISVIRSAFNRERRSKVGFWGWVACFLAIGGMIRTPLNLLGVVPQRESDIREQFAILNASLPTKLDDVTTLVRIAYNNKHVSYDFDVDASVGPIDLETMKREGMKDFCESWQSSLDSGELSAIDYRYLVGGEMKTFSVVKEDCI